MKNLLILIICLMMLPPLVWSQEKVLNYQGVLRDLSGEAVPDDLYNITFKLYNQATGGSPLWEEAHSGVDAVSVRNGVFAVTLGKIDTLRLNFDEPYWLAFAVAGGAEMLPRTRLTASPYTVSVLPNADGEVLLDRSFSVGRSTDYVFGQGNLHFRNTSNYTYDWSLECDFHCTGLCNVDESGELRFFFYTNEDGYDEGLVSYIDDNGSYHVASDRRLKKDIHPLHLSMEKILQLQPSQYHFKAQPEAPHQQIGLIAQDVAKILPSLVNTDDKGYHYINYDQVNVVAIAAVQQMDQQIERNQTEIEALEESINTLKSALSHHHQRASR